MTTLLEVTFGAILSLAPMTAFVGVVAITLLKTDAGASAVRPSAQDSE